MSWASCKQGNISETETACPDSNGEYYADAEDLIVRMVLDAYIINTYIRNIKERLKMTTNKTNIIV